VTDKSLQFPRWQPFGQQQPLWTEALQRWHIAQVPKNATNKILRFPRREPWIYRTGFNVGMRRGVGRAPRREHWYIDMYAEKLRVLSVGNTNNADQFIRWTDADFCSHWSFAPMAHRLSAKECDSQDFAIAAVRAIRTATTSVDMVHSSSNTSQTSLRLLSIRTI